MEGVTSLRHLCLKKIASQLWHVDDTRYLLSSNSRIETLIEKMAERKVSLLEIPKTLCKELQGRVSSLGEKTYKWFRWVGWGCPMIQILSPKMPAEFGLTSSGELDEKKTVAILAKDESFDLEKRFQLACIYNLRECVHALWEKKPQIDKILYFKNGRIEKLKYQQIIVMWTQILQLEDEHSKTSVMIDKLMRSKTTLQRLYDLG